jgi:hypothetical protein
MSETRETTSADMDQVIPHLAEDIASGRVEETRSFAQKIHNVNVFVQKKNKYHAVAGEDGRCGRTYPI